MLPITCIGRESPPPAPGAWRRSMRRRIWRVVAERETAHDCFAWRRARQLDSDHGKTDGLEETRGGGSRATARGRPVTAGVSFAHQDGPCDRVEIPRDRIDAAYA